MKAIKSKRINWFLATEHNALWLDNKTVVNSVDLFVEYLSRFERNLLRYEGRGKFSFYFRFKSGARFRIADHDVMTVRSISNISVVRSPFHEFENVKYNWFEYISHWKAKNNFEFYFFLLSKLKNSFENNEDYIYLENLKGKMKFFFEKINKEIFFPNEFYSLFFFIKKNHFSLFETEKYLNMFWNDFYLADETAIFYTLKKYFLVKKWKIIWLKYFNGEIIFPNNFLKEDYCIWFKWFKKLNQI